MGTYYKWDKYTYEYLKNESYRGVKTSFRNETNPRYTQSRITITPIQSGEYAGYFTTNASFRTISGGGTINNAIIVIPGNVIFIDGKNIFSNYYEVESGTMTLTYDPYVATNNCTLESNNNDYIINYIYTSQGRGTFVESVYSTSSTGYPNGAAADGYWYDYLPQITQNNKYMFKVIEVS